jgi:hypothetical protein
MHDSIYRVNYFSSYRGREICIRFVGPHSA